MNRLVSFFLNLVTTYNIFYAQKSLDYYYFAAFCCNRVLFTGIMYILEDDRDLEIERKFKLDETISSIIFIFNSI